MKKYIIFIVLTIYTSVFYSQKPKPINGNVISDFGKFYTIKKPDLLLDKKKEYKVIFDVYSDEKSNKKMNSSINTVARFLNMHDKTNINRKNLHIVLVLHGAATKNSLSDEAYKREFNIKNPNTDLIKKLKKADVEIYVCGQSFVHNNYKKNDLSKNVKLSLSALTALVEYQSRGYQLITFN